jgi:hypothetical protein
VDAPINIAGLRSHELVALAREQLTHGRGVAPRVYKEALRFGRFEPEQHGSVSARPPTGGPGSACSCLKCAGW